MSCENSKYRHHSATATTVYILLFCAICLCTSVSKAEESQALKAKERQQLIYLAKQFRERIKANEHEVRKLINETEWLQNRIRHLEDIGEPVPWRVYNSIDLKQKKIQTAINENERLNELLGQQKYRALENEHGYNTEFDVQDLFESPRTGSPSTSALFPGSGNSSFFPTTDFSTFKKDLANKIKQSGLEEWVQFSPDENCCTLETVLPILFASGSARIPNEYKDFFGRLARLVKSYDVRIHINGYADPDNIHTKKYPSNFELGATRAANIVHELVRNGVKPSVFQIGTTGKYRLEAKGMSAKKPLERRADLKIIFISKPNMG